MFATLSGSYPASPGPVDETVRSIVDAQVAAGLAPVSDGDARWADPFTDRAAQIPGALVAAWQATAALAGTVPVRQLVPGPYTVGHRTAGSGRKGRERVVLAAAERANTELLGLAAAGCPLAWVAEPDAVLIGDDDAERALFRAAQQRLLAGVDGIHPTLAIGGGDAVAAGIATIADAAFHSFFFDLIDGPDNWRLIAALPGDRGVICGAMEARTKAPADRELIVWAAHYAASTGGRGLERVGLAPSGGLGHLSPEAARRKIDGLAQAAAIAVSSTDEMRAALDPRAWAGPSARLAERARRATSGR